jgi:hypothetical protein
MWAFVYVARICLFLSSTRSRIFFYYINCKTENCLTKRNCMFYTDAEFCVQYILVHVEN